MSDTVELDEILRSFDPKTRAAFQDWMQTQAAGDRRARAATSTTRSATSAPFAEDTATIVDILNRQEGAVSRLVANTGIVFEALSERDGQLRSLIENSNTVFATTAARDERAAGGVPGAADVREASRELTFDRLTEFADDDRSAGHAAAAGGARALADARGPRGHRARPARTCSSSCSR